MWLDQKQDKIPCNLALQKLSHKDDQNIPEIVDISLIDMKVHMDNSFVMVIMRTKSLVQELV